jgi:hypothetical protein
MPASHLGAAKFQSASQIQPSLLEVGENKGLRLDQECQRYKWSPGSIEGVTCSFLPLVRLTLRNTRLKLCPAVILRLRSTSITKRVTNLLKETGTRPVLSRTRRIRDEELVTATCASTSCGRGLSEIRSQPKWQPSRCHHMHGSDDGSDVYTCIPMTMTIILARYPTGEPTKLRMSDRD